MFGPTIIPKSQQIWTTIPLWNHIDVAELWFYMEIAIYRFHALILTNKTVSWHLDPSSIPMNIGTLWKKFNVGMDGHCCHWGVPLINVDFPWNPPSSYLGYSIPISALGTSIIWEILSHVWLPDAEIPKVMGKTQCLTWGQLQTTHVGVFENAPSPKFDGVHTRDLMRRSWKIVLWNMDM